MTVSIITSAYNAEKTIEKTVNSILQQNYVDFEYIIINHGSIDNTLQLIEEFSKKDKRIKIINIQDNQGYIGKALNMGLLAAKGKYITFLDADDYYEKTYLEEMVNKASYYNCDIIICGFNRINKSNKIIRYDTIDNEFYLYDRNDYRNFFEYMTGYTYGYLYVWWNKLYKKEYLFKNNFLFPEDMKVHADVVFNANVFMNKPTVCCISKCLVNWRCIEGSVSFGTYKKGYYLEALKGTELFSDLFKKYVFDEVILRQLHKKLTLSISHLQRLKDYKVNKKEIEIEFKEWINNPFYRKLIEESSMQQFVEEFKGIYIVKEHINNEMDE